MSQLASVVMPTCNKAPFLALTLASYTHQSCGDYELIIVDDGSRDDTRAVVERYQGRLPIRYLYQENRGRAAARNRGLTEARGDIVIFSDDDRLVEADFVKAHLRRFVRGAPAVVALGWQRAVLTFWRRDLHVAPHLLWRNIARGSLHKIIGDEGPLASEQDLSTHFAPTVARLEMEEYWWTTVLPVLARYGDDLEGFALPWLLGTTANMSAPRDALIAVGGFDDGFRGWGIEDHEVCYRLHYAGLRTVIARDAINWHQAHPQSPGKWRDWMRNLLYFMNRHPRLDVAYYVFECANQRAGDYADINERWLRLANEAAPPALEAGLREAYARFAERRFDDIAWSGALRFLGRSYEEWL